MVQPRLRLYTKRTTYAQLLLSKAVLASKTSRVLELEGFLQKRYGCKNVVLTSMGRMAIYLALKAMDKTGEVIVSPITVPEVIQLIKLSGCTPVFCDVKPGAWNFDTGSVSKCITKNTVAIMTTYYYGDASSAAEIKKICTDNNLVMIEDAAQALGVKTELGYAGTIGDFGVYSFSYPKNVTSFYGGALVVRDETHARRVRQLVDSMRALDKRWFLGKALDCMLKDFATSRWVFPTIFHAIRFGFKYNVKYLKAIGYQRLNNEGLKMVPAQYLTKMSEVQASIILKGLESVGVDMRHRVSIARVYDEVIIEGVKSTKPRFTADGSHGYLYYPFQVRDKYHLQSYLIINGVDVAVQHTPNCQSLPANSESVHPCPVAEFAAEGTVMLPTYPGFSEVEAQKIARLINQYLVYG